MKHILFFTLCLFFTLPGFAQVNATSIQFPANGGNGTFSSSVSRATAYSVVSDAAWVRLTSQSADLLANGSQTVNVAYVVDSTSGSRAGTVRILYANGLVSQLNISQAGKATMVSAASYSAGKLAAGGMASVFNDGVHSFADSIAGGTVPLPTSLNGVSVNLVKSDGSVSYPCKLLFVAPTQVNVVLPENIAEGVYSVYLKAKTGELYSDVIYLHDTNPDLFTYNQKGTGHVALTVQRNYPGGAVVYDNPIVITDGTNTWANPINLSSQSGEEVYILLYGTGIKGGSLASSYVRFGGQTLSLVYAGQQGQYAGLDQAAFRVPSNLTGGDYQLTLTINGKSSATVTVPVLGVTAAQ